MHRSTAVQSKETVATGPHRVDRMLGLRFWPRRERPSTRAHKNCSEKVSPLVFAVRLNCLCFQDRSASIKQLTTAAAGKVC